MAAGAFRGVISFSLSCLFLYLGCSLYVLGVLVIHHICTFTTTMSYIDFRIPPGRILSSDGLSLVERVKRTRKTL
ncbi:hypothetical protein BDV36DRAFT_250190 [Aspergillus pseudocaelatus]|uniref:Uncharacterized protein n=1 Tax=Aspergillus pseudocaelatus TaxID=1825620 RepID=A0ABQ6WST0_9EURO|nr:hypothetical protein BDV36DRAFT_250190 [Aspergillus pseudocaelatus]